MFLPYYLLPIISQVANATFLECPHRFSDCHA